MKIPDNFNYRNFLKEELRRRQKRNSAYSVRAYSRDLGMGPSRLSEILGGKAGISVDRAVFIAERLQLKDEQRTLFIDLVQCEHSRSPLAKKSAQDRIESRMKAFKVLEASEEHLLLADWYNLAVLELIPLEETHTVEHFAARLGLPTETVADSVERLLKEGFLQRIGDKWEPREKGGDSTEDIPSATIRNFHRKVIEKALPSLENRPVDERDFSSILFSMSARDIPFVKERIREFRRDLAWELNQKPQKDGVYCLSMQFFELTEKPK
jgi:uncharacterized protein (TIGR02147 family)